MTFEEALWKACLESAKALGDDIKKISWLLSNKPAVARERDKAA
jgi:hypothetical protein